MRMEQSYKGILAIVLAAGMFGSGTALAASSPSGTTDGGVTQTAPAKADSLFALAGTAKNGKKVYVAKPTSQALEEYRSMDSDNQDVMLMALARVGEANDKKAEVEVYTFIRRASAPKNVVFVNTMNMPVHQFVGLDLKKHAKDPTSLIFMKYWEMAFNKSYDLEDDSPAVPAPF